MSFNAQKTPFQRTMNRFVEGKVQDGTALAGKSWPCRVKTVAGSIVTVEFLVASPFTVPLVKMPVFGPEYIRYPIKIGDLGITLAADVYIGNVTGLGDGSASNLALRGNLSTLVFLPVGNINWAAVTDPNQLVLYGPDGTVMQTQDGTMKLVVDKIGSRSVGPFAAGNGVSGTFLLADHKTITVENGILTGGLP